MSDEAFNQGPGGEAETVKLRGAIQLVIGSCVELLNVPTGIMVSEEVHLRIVGGEEAEFLRTTAESVKPARW